MIEPASGGKRQGRRFPQVNNRVRTAAATTFMLSLLIEVLGSVVADSVLGGRWQGPLTVAVYVVAPLALLVLLVGQGLQWWHQHADRRGRGVRETDPAQGAQVPSETRRVAELAEQAAFWAGRLAGADATEARSWFRVKEPALRQELEERARAGQSLPDHDVEDLASIADSLETWYVYQQDLDELAGLSERLREIASRARRPELEQLAALRTAAARRLRGYLSEAQRALAEAGEIEKHAARHAHALQARRHHERALIHLAQAKLRGKGGVDELENADLALRDGWSCLPRADISGQVTTQINLAALALQQQLVEDEAGAREPDGAGHQRGKRLSQASGHLESAEAMAKSEYDQPGLAHAIELQGVAAWLDGRHQRAAGRWRDARDRYAALDLTEGQARCLQHLGSAILSGVPEVAGLLRDGGWRAPGEAAALAEARSLLERSRKLRAELPHADTVLVDRYLNAVREREREVGDTTDSLHSLRRGLAARVRRWLRRLAGGGSGRAFRRGP